MNTPSLFAWSFDPTWAVPVLGGAVAGLAWVVGRRLLAPRPDGPRKEGGPGPDERTFLEGYTLERRATPRRRGNLVEIEVAGEGSEPIRGWVADRSIGGLCVLVEQPLAEGSKTRLRPKGSPEATLWVPVLIKNCRPEEEHWEVGCQFIGTPPYNILLSFG